MTTVRLATNGDPERLRTALGRKEDMTTMRLAIGRKGLGGPGGAGFEQYVTALKQRSPKEDMTTVRLAAASLDSTQRYPSMPKERAVGHPALLIAFPYIKAFQAIRERIAFRDWVLDSGAFSAHNAGIHIDLQEYIDLCKQLLATDPQLTEVFALDVIGDWKASLKNCEAMWKQDVPAIPCYHVGEPEHVLKTICAEYPKVALGGAVGLHAKRKKKWAEQCFARVWPKRIHGFGFGSEDMVLSLPFESVDASSWSTGPCNFGNWRTYGKVSIRGSFQDLRPEVEWHLKLEQKAKAKWGTALAKLQPRKESA